MSKTITWTAALLGSMALAGCSGPKTLYQWEGYQAQVHEYFKGESKEAQAQALGLALDRRFLLDLAHVVAVQHVEAIGLLQVGDENGLGLAAEAVDAIGKDPAHVAGAVVELAYRNRRTHAAVGSVDALDLLYRQRGGGLGGAARQAGQGGNGEERQ